MGTFFHHDLMRHVNTLFSFYKLQQVFIEPDLVLCFKSILIEFSSYPYPIYALKILLSKVLHVYINELLQNQSEGRFSKLILAKFQASYACKSGACNKKAYMLISYEFIHTHHKQYNDNSTLASTISNDEHRLLAQQAKT